MSAVLLRALNASDKSLPQSALSWLQQTSTVAAELGNTISNSFINSNIDDGYILVDHYGEKGVRKTMEDECVVLPSLRRLNPELPGAYDFLVCALFDGHGGRTCAAFAKENLLHEIVQQLLQQLQAEPTHSDEFSESLFKKAVNAACLRLDSRIAHDLIGCNDGCTALLLFIGSSRIYVVNLGDSAAYLCRKLNNVLHAIPLNEVHKAWIPKEKERILHYGGTVEGSRVNGVLEVTRSFGDLGLKRFGVKCTGSFRQASLDYVNDDIILVACDGFWSVYDPHEACRTALRFLRQDESRAKSDPQLPFVNLRKVCKDLVENALGVKRAQDNVSVMLLRLVRKSD
ncbi:phosphatase 2C domain-containing protein [Babesia ovis]|uniref:protein-serine/threonine phosphatase n=1 Tax=Babesia ovis TaxID=5869 RepID=A0A9W5WVP7_BABOV|nr:phosphatase 2C domain-containing protein [Babesia ovis]